MSFNPQPSYTTASGMQVMFCPAVNKRPRRTSLMLLPAGTTIYLIAHFTESTTRDSRAYLWSPSDGRAVSAHYCTGIYADTGPAPIAYKYASENSDCTYTEGYGLMGQLLTYDHASDWNDGVLNGVRVNANINDRAIGYEIEANATAAGMPSPALLNSVTAHMAEIMRYWMGFGYEVVLLGHKHIDSEKSDPQLNWTLFDKQVKAQL